jgi:predicted PurR-regulated permease PerM
MKPMLLPTLRFFIGLAYLSIAIPFLHSARPLINSFLLALLIVMAVSPLLYWLRRQEYPIDYQTWARQVPNRTFIMDRDSPYR